MKLEDRMRLSIRRRAGNVVLRTELAGLGSASQVSHALNSLQRNGELVRLGTGVYAKAVRAAATGVVQPLTDFETLAREAAGKLKISAPVTASTTRIAGTPQDRNLTLILDTGHRRVSRKLALGSNSVAYVNDRTRSRVRPHESRSRLADPDRRCGAVRPQLRAQAQGELYANANGPVGRNRDAAGGCMSGSGPVQDLLVALKRAGKLSADDMATLLVNYLRERKQRVRSV